MRDWGEGGGLEGVGILVRGRLERYPMIRKGAGKFRCRSSDPHGEGGEGQAESGWVEG